MKYLLALIEVPNDVLVKDAKDFIRSELKAAGGFKHPDDPLHSGLQAIKFKSVRLDARSSKRWSHYSNVSD